MARKRITDLIQEEAQKYSPINKETAIEVTAEPITETDTVSTIEVESAPSEKAAIKRTSTPTKADLEANISELQQNLKQSQQNETTLQQQIAELQSNLAEKTAFIEQLQTELWDTKKAALQLAESNTALIEEMNNLKQQKEQEQQIEIEKQQKKAKQTAITKPTLSYRKSYRPVEPKPQPAPPPSNEFADKMWLLD